MAFTLTSRVWWDNTQPGQGTTYLLDAETPANASTDNSTGFIGLEQGPMVVCARSGFEVPFSETVLDAVTGARVWAKFADSIPETDQDSLNTPYDGLHINESNDG